MTTLALILVLGGHHGGHSFHGGSGTRGPQPGWLLDDDGKPWRDVALMSQELLLEEQTRLEAKRPGYGAPIFLIILGVVTALTGVGFAIGGIIDATVTMVASWALYVGAGLFL